MNPQRTIGSLNLLKPLCPVLFNEIKFSYMDSQERQMRSLRRNDDKFVVVSLIYDLRLMHIYINVW